MPMRRLFNMPPQVVRVVLLAVGIVASYLVARYFLTPPSFREYGFYRGAALAELATRDRVYAGENACVEKCHNHQDQYQTLMKHEHKTLACESCHGPGQAHSNDPRKDNIEKSSYATCLRCHEANPSRPKWHKQIASNNHYPGKCTECHVPHSPSESP